MAELPVGWKQRIEVLPNNCWAWRGARRSEGRYGNIKRAGLNVPAHRAFYEAGIGPIPAGLVLDHLCRNTLCVNPTHLEPVTIGENTRRGRR